MTPSKATTKKATMEEVKAADSSASRISGSILETVSSSRSFTSMLKLVKELEAASFGLIASYERRAGLAASVARCPELATPRQFSPRIVSSPTVRQFRRSGRILNRVSPRGHTRRRCDGLPAPHGGGRGIDAGNAEYVPPGSRRAGRKPPCRVFGSSEGYRGRWS